MACNSHDLLPNGATISCEAGENRRHHLRAGQRRADRAGKALCQRRLGHQGPITISTTATQVTVLSCLTPDVLVNLGRHKSSEFEGSGNIHRDDAFNVALKSCPAGINRVTYQVDAATPVVNAANSVVALDSGSTATGVGVQLLDGSGNVFPLGNGRRSSRGYSTSAGGDYDITFNARYYQTGPTVGAGSANTAMTFTMSYE